MKGFPSTLVGTKIGNMGGFFCR